MSRSHLNSSAQAVAESRWGEDVRECHDVFRVARVWHQLPAAGPCAGRWLAKADQGMAPSAKLAFKWLLRQWDPTWNSMCSWASRKTLTAASWSQRGTYQLLYDVKVPRVAVNMGLQATSGHVFWCSPQSLGLFHCRPKVQLCRISRDELAQAQGGPSEKRKRLS